MSTVETDEDTTLKHTEVADQDAAQVGAYLRVKRYDPDKSSYGPRLTKAEWNNFQPLLTQLHNRGLPRHKVIEIARDQHGFRGKYAALHKRFKEWGLTTTRDNEWTAISTTTSKIDASDDSSHIVNLSKQLADVYCQPDNDEAGLHRETSARGDFSRPAKTIPLPDS